MRLLNKWFLIVLLSTAGCSHWHAAPELPVASTVVLDDMVVYSDFKLPEKHRLLQDMSALRIDLTQQLAVPESDEPVHVYLFKTPKRYREFVRQHYPDFPERRAFFIETDSRLCVYTYWGDRVAEDLRHEVAHGYLHAVIPNLPLWLDEGLAEYFEVDLAARGMNRAHLDQLLAASDQGHWRPDIKHLESLDHIDALQQIHYAEAWLWVHFLLRTTPQRKQLLRDHLSQLYDPLGKPLAEVIVDQERDAEQQLLGYLEILRRNRPLLSENSTAVKLQEAR